LEVTDRAIATADVTSQTGAGRRYHAQAAAKEAIAKNAMKGSSRANRSILTPLDTPRGRTSHSPAARTPPNQPTSRRNQKYSTIAPRQTMVEAAIRPATWPWPRRSCAAPIRYFAVGGCSRFAVKVPCTYSHPASR